MTMIKKILLLSLLTVAMALPVAAELVEAVLVRVGDRIITRSEYMRRLAADLEQIERTTPPEAVAARKAERPRGLLDEMIAELLIRDRSDRLGMGVSDQEVAQAIERLKAQYGIQSEEDFALSLEQAGMTRSEMEARLRDTLRSNKLFARELRARSELTDRELRRRYEREQERYRRPERARVREIIVLIPEGADAVVAGRLETRAREAHERALKGESFETLVAEYSESPSREDGGAIGIVSRGELLPALDQAVFASDAGAVVGPIRTRFGFHLLRIDERIPSEIPAFDEIKEQLRREESDAAFQRDLDAYLENLRKEAFVVIHEDRIPGV
jgi:parvulin-like peptidyl-prolyl isomerase